MFYFLSQKDREMDAKRYCKRTYFRTRLIFGQGPLSENKSSENSIPRQNVLSRGRLSEN